MEKLDKRIIEQDFIDEIARKTGFPKLMTKVIVKSVFGMIAKELKHGKNVHFGRDVGKIVHRKGEPVFVKGIALRR